MRAGSLDRRITLRHRSVTRDAQGQEVVSYTDYDTVWAGRRDLRAREFLAAQQVYAENTRQYSLRYRADILQTDVLVDDGVTYNIRQIAEIGRRKSIELLCTAMVS